MPEQLTLSPTRSDVRSYCRICIAQCGIIVTVEDGPDEPIVSHVGGDADHPVSQGYTCAKGRALPALHHHPARLEYPLLREPDGTQQRVTWDVLLDDLAARVAHIVATDGPDAVAFFFSTGVVFDAAGRRVAERFMRKIGTRSKYTSMTIDSVAKPMAAELVGGWPWINPLVDEESCRLTLMIGINPLISHGHSSAMSNPLARVRAQREIGELWVLDPRRTETARAATRHLQPRPGTDAFTLGFLVRELLADGADDRYLADHSSDADRLAAAVEPLTAHRVAAATGLTEGELADLLAAVRRAGRIAVLAGTGVTMAPGANVAEWLRLALLVVTGSIDHPGGMWCNPGFLSRLDTKTLPTSPPEGLIEPGPASRPDLHGQFGEFPCAALADEIAAGNVKALFVMGGNVLRSFPDSDGITAALSALDVCAVVDIVETETTLAATHVLPTTGQLERADIPIFLDAFLDRVMSQRTAAVVPPVAQRRPLWWSMAQLADRLGFDVLPGSLTADTASDEALFEPLISRSHNPSALTEPTGVALAPDVSRFGWITDRVLPDGRWRLAPAPLVGQLVDLLAGQLDPGLPDPLELTLVPRRMLRVMNSQFRDARVRGETQPAYVLVHPHDAAAAGILDGARIRVIGRHGATEGRARVTDEIRVGAISMPHAWGDPDVQRLTSTADDVDPYTGMVLLSGLPVRIEAVND
ncbi:MAG: putative dehydrogenase [Pseudonocardiales bacterium]|nr:putative dehydrogenase [Pseudonocardiales bacterium]